MQMLNKLYSRFRSLLTRDFLLVGLMLWLLRCAQATNKRENGLITQS